MAVAKDNSKLKVIKVHGKLRCSINQKNLIYHQNQLIKVGKTVNRSEVVVEEVAATNDTKQIAIRIQNKDLLQIKVHVVVMKLGVKINTIDLPQIKAKEGVATSDTKQQDSDYKPPTNLSSRGGYEARGQDPYNRPPTNQNQRGRGDGE